MLEKKLPSGLFYHRYNFLRTLHVSPYAKVYLVEDSLTDDIYAAEYFPCGYIPHYEFAHLSKIAHRAFPKVYGLYVDDDKWTMLTDPCGDETLTMRRLRYGGNLPFNEVREIALQLVSALDHIHAASQARLSLCPHTIFIMPDGEVRLCGAIRQKVEISEYSAPEVRATGRGGVGADIYALGVILAELLAGTKSKYTFIPDGERVSALWALCMQMSEEQVEMRPKTILVVMRALLSI